MTVEPVTVNTGRQGDLKSKEIATGPNWLQLVRAEYLEIPGLHLTRRQAQRLWNLDEVTCDAVMGSLINVGFLKMTVDGAFVRTENSVH